MSVKMKNYKVFNVNEIASLILDFHSVDKPSLQRMTANRLENVMNDMVESGEVDSILIHSQDTYRRTRAYFYESFDKVGQMKANDASFFPHYLTSNDIKFGTLSVNLATQNLRVPVFVEDDKFYIVDTEIIPLRRGEIGIFVEPVVEKAVPVYVVDDRLNYADLIPKLTKNSIVIEKETLVAFVVEVVSGKPTSKRLEKEHFLSLEPKAIKSVSNKEIINTLLSPYLLAEQREEAMKAKLVNGGYKGKNN